MMVGGAQGSPSQGVGPWTAIALAKVPRLNTVVAVPALRFLRRLKTCPALPVRAKRHVVGEGRAHRDEVCGLRFGGHGSLLASGGNDNRALIWDVRRSADGSKGLAGAVLQELSHHAAVKALAWCPAQVGIAGK